MKHFFWNSFGCQTDFQSVFGEKREKKASVKLRLSRLRPKKNQHRANWPFDKEYCSQDQDLGKRDRFRSAVRLSEFAANSIEHRGT